MKNLTKSKANQSRTIVVKELEIVFGGGAILANSKKVEIKAK